MALELESLNVTGLHIVANERNVRRDIHTYIAYVREQRVKRQYRTNALGKTDSMRLAKLMGDPELIQAVKESGGARWIDFVDRMVHRLGLVSYDIQGSYRGYSSSEPSFPNNYIEFQANAYEQFLALPLAQQERRLLDALVDEYAYSQNEFFSTGILGVLDGFVQFGSALGVLPSLNFAAIRRYLLNLLQQVEPGEWFSTASLVAYLKAHEPHFLIPKHPKIIRQWKDEASRYGNFREVKSLWDRGISVPDDAPDGFERVEGRYIERFLEYIPLLLNYVDVAYDQTAYDSITSESYRYGAEQPGITKPSRQVLRAFRVHTHLHQAMSGSIPAPIVRVQPNFEIYIESAFYPAALINQLAPLTEPVSEGTTTIRRLTRQQVAAYHATHDKEDVVARLRGLSAYELPGNVVIELQEWAGEADIFTLYEGCGLVEAVGKMPSVGKFKVETITPGLALVRRPADLIQQWQKEGRVVMVITHPDNRCAPLPDTAQTLFPKQADIQSIPETPAPQPVVLRQQVMITMFFPEKDILEAFRRVLLEARCPVEVDLERQTLTLAQRYEPEIRSAVDTLSDSYQIEIEDLI